MKTKRCLKYVAGITCAVLLGPMAVNLSFAQDKLCADPQPPEAACVAVRPLGEINGCACFVCYAATGNREQTICTQDRQVKDNLSRKPKR